MRHVDLSFMLHLFLTCNISPMETMEASPILNIINRIHIKFFVIF